jgi:hypothetical protein
MHEWIILGVVAILFYLLECCAWIPIPCRACFRQPLHGRWQTASAAELIGNDRGGALMSAPFDLSGAVVQGCEWPFTVNPEGVANVSVTDADNQDAEFIPFADIGSVRAVFETVQINGRPFVKVPSAILAAEVAGLLQQFQSARPQEREKLIRSAIRDRLSVPDIERRWKLFRHETKLVRLASLMGAAWLFLASPIVLVVFGPLASWPYLLVGVLAVACVTSVLYFRAHRRLFHTAAADRWTHAVSMSLFPVAALRACDRLAKDLFYRFEPVALVAAFCNGAAGTSTIRAVVFDLSHWRVAANQSGPLAACRTWHRDIQQREVSRMLGSIDVDLVAVPVAEDGSMKTFCPRCHTQYGERVSTCAMCADVALTPLTVVAPPRVSVTS